MNSRDEIRRLLLPRGTPPHSSVVHYQSATGHPCVPVPQKMKKGAEHSVRKFFAREPQLESISCPTLSAGVAVATAAAAACRRAKQDAAAPAAASSGMRCPGYKLVKGGD